MALTDQGLVDAAKAIALGLGTGFGAIGPGVGVGYLMFLGLALTEAITFYALLMSFVAFFIA